MGCWKSRRLRFVHQASFMERTRTDTSLRQTQSALARTRFTSGLRRVDLFQSRIASGWAESACGISLNLVSAFFGFLFPQRFVMDRRRRRCGNCGKAGAFFAEAFPNSLWKSSRRSRRRLPCSISTAAAVSTARCRPAQGCVWRGGNRCRSPMPGIRPGCRSSLIGDPGEDFFRV